jgi:hypothetical protein
MSPTQYLNSRFVIKFDEVQLIACAILIRGYKTTNIVITEEEITSVTKPPIALYTQPVSAVFQITQPVSSIFFLILLAYCLVGHQIVLVLKMFRKNILYLNVFFSQTYFSSSSLSFLGL